MIFASHQVCKWIAEKLAIKTLDMKELCQLAAHGGHLEVLKWAVGVGAPWGYTIHLALQNQQWAIAEWACMSLLSISKNVLDCVVIE